METELMPDSGIDVPNIDFETIYRAWDKTATPEENPVISAMFTQDAIIGGPKMPNLLGL